MVVSVPSSASATGTASSGCTIAWKAPDTSLRPVRLTCGGTVGPARGVGPSGGGWLSRGTARASSASLRLEPAGGVT